MAPSSSPTKPHPSELPNGDVLVGTGERVVKLGFVEINVYSLGLYVDPDACRSALLPAFDSVTDHDSLLSEGSTFYPAFVAGKFRKTFHLTFCRSIGRDKCVGGFEVPLRQRCDDDHRPDADELLSKLVPSSGVANDDSITIVCDGDGATLTATYRWASGKSEELVRVESGGEGGAWMGFQNIYFDADTTLPTIKHGSVSGLPDVLNAPQSSTYRDSSSSSERQKKQQGGERQPSEKEIEEALDREYVQGGSSGRRKKKTWSEFAGRDASDGGTGYKFGDLTLGVVNTIGDAIGVKKKQSSSSSDEKNKDSTGSGAPSGRGDSDRPGVDAAELEKLRTEKGRVEIENKRLLARLARAEEVLAEADRTLPMKILLALILSEVVGLALGRVLGRSEQEILATKLVLHVVLGVVAVARCRRAGIGDGGKVKAKTS